MTLKSYRPKPTSQQELWSRPSTLGLLARLRLGVVGEETHAKGPGCFSPFVPTRLGTGGFSLLYNCGLLKPVD